MTDTAAERAAAIAALVSPTGVDGSKAAATPLIESGNVVEAGGDVRRLLVKPAHLSYVEGTGSDRVLLYAKAEPGDVVLLTAKEAKRLDAIDVTREEGADLKDVVDETPAPSPAPSAPSPVPGVPTDEELEAMSAAELVAYVGQHPDAAPRVRELELAKRESKQRSSILEATDPEKLDTTTE